MSRRRPSRWHGLLPVHKSAGPTSHDIVDMARKALRERRIGHTGTLDPMAEGLLLLCVGGATRLQQYLLDWDKTYRGLVRLGRATTTYDGEGETTGGPAPVPDLGRAELDAAEAAFTGEIEQQPPPFSAKKVAGRKLYEIARSGEEVEVAAKRVAVHALRLELVTRDVIELEVTTSSGFYVRSLAHDLGLHFGCGGFLEHLERLRIGPWNATEALRQEALEAAADPGDVLASSAWVPLERIALPFPRIDLNPSAAERFLHGQEVIMFRATAEPLAAGDRVAAHALGGELLGIGTVQTVLARGRTVAVQPTTVLGAAPVRHGALTLVPPPEGRR